jgi:hypothetical protein
VGAIYRDQDIELNLQGATIGGFLWGGGGDTVLLFERCRVHVFNGTIDCNTGSHNSHSHGIRFLNCPVAHAHDLQFRGGPGDGIYISHDNPGGVGQGSEQVVIERVHGTGNHLGRNFISIICGRTMRITDWSSTNWTLPGMPGGLDIEPDFPQEYVNDVHIARGVVRTSQPGALFGIGAVNYIAHANMVGITTEDCRVEGPHNAGFALYGSPHQDEGVTHIRPQVSGCPPVYQQDGTMTLVNPGFPVPDNDDCRKRCRKKNDKDARRKCLRRCES